LTTSHLAEATILRMDKIIGESRC